MTYIPLEAVESSMISQIGYDQKKETLRIVFHNGAVYDYPIFPERDWVAFREAESIGQHFHRAIKPVFAYGRVAESDLQEPCCDHPDRDTCNDSCLPCDSDCCPGQTEAQRQQQLAALATGIEHGRQLIERARQGASDSPETVVCPHANKEATESGSIIGCADCGADLSPEVVD